MKKVLVALVILVLSGVACGADWIQFPSTSMGPNETQTFDITGNLDQALAVGVQVMDITLAPVGGVTGTLSITAITTNGSSFHLEQGANWDDWSGADWLIGMTGDFSVTGVFGPLTAGFVTLVSSPGASGTWDLLVGHTDSDGYPAEIGSVFGTVYDGQITVEVVPEPGTMVLLGLGGLALRRRSGRALRRG